MLKPAQIRATPWPYLCAHCCGPEGRLLIDLGSVADTANAASVRVPITEK